ncbi:hypothetical protein [Catenovulum sediminis]|uniref:hypothetical protein n=1 Tax=Catenovulum sediminis TaxID=1740262 RepID=UPI00118066AF|nr:hypothetical protein [Catenovulum sediminis]
MRPTRSERLDTSRQQQSLPNDIAQDKNGHLYCGVACLVCTGENEWTQPGGKVIKDKLQAFAKVRNMNYKMSKVA